jgi:metal-dependent amidase/aminoacylase/carboxypeptidase family protein
MGDTVRACTTGYIQNLKNRLEYIVDFMYDDSGSLNEERSRTLLCDLFTSEGFNVEKDVYDVKNSFKATYGNEPTGIAYICDYDSNSKVSNVCSHNFTSAMNAGAALGLKRAITEIGGSVTVFGCPSNSKIKLLNMGAFNGTNAIICGHATYKTSESGSSLGSTSIDFTFKRKKSGNEIEVMGIASSLNPCILLFNLSELFKANYPAKFILNYTIKNNNDFTPEETSCSFTVKGCERNIINFATEELIECAKFAARLYGFTVKCNKAEHSYEPLKTHPELSRIACHNLKECGITNIHAPVIIGEGIDLGNISNMIPTINPGIGICKKDLNLTAEEFNKTVRSPFSKENMIKAACALALTGVDVIQKPEVLKN